MPKSVKKQLEKINSLIRENSMNDAARKIGELRRFLVADSKAVELYITMRGMSWHVRHFGVTEETIALYRFLIHDREIEAQVLDLDMFLTSTVTDVRAQVIYVDFLYQLTDSISRNKNLYFALLNFAFLQEGVGPAARRGMLNLYRNQPDLEPDSHLQDILSSGLRGLVRNYRKDVIDFHNKSLYFSSYGACPVSQNVRELLEWGQEFGERCNDRTVFDRVFLRSPTDFDWKLLAGLLNVSSPNFFYSIVQYLDVDLLIGHEDLISILKLTITIIKKDIFEIAKKRLFTITTNPKPDFESFLFVLRAKATVGGNESINEYLIDMYSVDMKPPRMEIDSDDRFFAFLFETFKSYKSKLDALPNDQSTEAIVVIFCTLFSTMLLNGYAPGGSFHGLVNHLSETAHQSRVSKELLNEFQAIAIKGLTTSPLSGATVYF